jgi:hypothetical protein
MAPILSKGPTIKLDFNYFLDVGLFINAYTSTDHQIARGC